MVNQSEIEVEKDETFKRSPKVVAVTGAPSSGNNPQGHHPIKSSVADSSGLSALNEMAPSDWIKCCESKVETKLAHFFLFFEKKIYSQKC